MAENEGVIEVYGHNNENSKYLALSTYDIEKNKLDKTNKVNDLVIYEDVMWIDKVFKVDDKKYIVNSLSILVLDKENKLIQTVKVDKSTIVDCEYDKKENQFIVLSKNYNILIYDNQFKLLEENKFKRYSRKQMLADLLVY